MSLLAEYERAKDALHFHGYQPEIAWQAAQCFDSFTESDLLRETAWVILCSGFREAVIRQRFDCLSLCFCDWQSAHEIVRHQSLCRETAIKVFRHQGKIEAIVDAAKLICENSFEAFKREVSVSPIETLRRFPYIGNITAWHLAKNLGLPVAKPDRHLVRLALKMGYSSVQKFCSDVANLTGDPIQVVDLVFWRYATLNGQAGESAHKLAA